MAKCRIQNLTPVCAYNGSGVTAVMLLDLDDFAGFVYRDSEGYETCFVETIQRTGSFVVVEFNDFPAQYNGPLVSGLYSHTIEAFISELSSEIISNLHLASKRPQLVVFKTWDGKYFTFGQVTGADVNYTAQTTDGTGAAVTFSQNSPYPLYEVSASAFDFGGHPYQYIPQFDSSAVCDINNATNVITGYIQSVFAIKVSTLTGEPLDINSLPIAQTGNKQAAITLTGYSAPSTYQTVGTFTRRALLNGEPTLRYAPDICQEGVVANWILETGFWDMSAYWLDEGIWNY